MVRAVSVREKEDWLVKIKERASGSLNNRRKLGDKVYTLNTIVIWGEAAEGIPPTNSAIPSIALQVMSLDYVHVLYVSQYVVFTSPHWVFIKSVHLER